MTNTGFVCESQVWVEKGGFLVVSLGGFCQEIGKNPQKNDESAVSQNAVFTRFLAKRGVIRRFCCFGVLFLLKEAKRPSKKRRIPVLKIAVFGIDLL